jgi:hypothetical protein
MDCDEPHLAPNEKMQPIEWIEQSTNALVVWFILADRYEGWFSIHAYT